MFKDGECSPGKVGVLCMKVEVYKAVWISLDRLGNVFLFSSFF